MTTWQIIKYVFLAILLVAVGGFLHYNLPRTEVVQITGTEVKRIDRKDPEQGQRTRDVRYLSTFTRDGKVRVFRNEDTGWGWPPYFKFGSADLTAEAQSIIQESQKRWVRVRYYGWRSNIFSLFPNALSLKVVDKDYTHIPVFNIVFLTLLVAGAFFLVRRFRRLGERIEETERFQSISQSFRKLLGRERR
jgi:hypothetical protein